MKCVDEKIFEYAAMAFQEKCNVAPQRFLDLLSLYMTSTFVEWDGQVFLQKAGVCIGSCIAPVLSDLYLASLDKKLNEELSGFSVAKIFRFVDDFLVIINSNVEHVHNEVAKIIKTFERCLQP